MIGSSYATTLRVAKDGTSEYSVLQDAVDAAASGDTILIGPGRYNDAELVSSAGWTDSVRVLIRQEELTIIGAGPDRTIIGPAVPFDLASQGHDRGIEAGPWWGCQRVFIHGIGFENMWGGIVGMDAPDIDVEDCRFTGNAVGIICGGMKDLSVRNSRFEHLGVDWGFLLYGNSMNNVEVWDCSFVLDGPATSRQQGVQFDGTLDVNMHNCEFDGGQFGLTFSGAVGSSAFVGNCRFVGQSIRGLSVVGQDANVDSCDFVQQGQAIYTYSPFWTLNVAHTTFREVASCTFGIDYIGTLSVHDCVLARGSMYTFLELSSCEKTAGELPHLDLTDNDWGTTDPDSIASWIHACDYVVDYIPFVGQQVPAEKQSLGDIKAKFLGR